MNNAYLLITILLVFAILLLKKHKGSNILDLSMDSINSTTLKNINVDDLSTNKYIKKLLKSGKNKHAQNKKIKLNPYFVDIRVHQDYTDTINSFELLMPNKKEIFNDMNNPVRNTESVDGETDKIVKQFIKEVNKMSSNSPDVKLGWNNISVKRNDSGWDEYMKNLGLPKSLYKDPAGPASIKLIKIDHVEKYETDTQIKYIIFMIVQKPNSDDQMIVRASIVVVRSDANLEREFFDATKNYYDTNVKIEDIFIVGFLTKIGTEPKSARDKLYEFEHISDGKSFNDRDVVTILNKKKQEIAKEFSSL